MLLTPCVTEVLEVDNVGQRATVVLNICMDWVDDGALEEDGEGGYRLKAEYLDEETAFRPDLMINNLVEEVRR